MPKATFLTDVLKNAGLKVKEERGWKSRGHGSMKGFHGILLHHTAGAKTGNFPSLNVVKNGRPGLGGPLANLGLARDGTWHIIAAGKAWHAGRGGYDWEGDNLKIKSGNDYLIGIEAENTGVANDSPWPEEQVESYVKGVAALLKHLNLKHDRAIGHKEWTSRKIDPSFSMNAFRRDLQKAMKGEDFDAGDDNIWEEPDAKEIQKRLNVWGHNLKVDGKIGSKTLAALRDFQIKYGFPKQDGVTENVWKALEKNKWTIEIDDLEGTVRPEVPPLPDPKPKPETDLDKDDNAHYAKGILVGLGWTPEQAAALIGNAMVESGEELFTKSNHKSGVPYGIMKWYSDRKNKLEEFSKDIDKNMDDLETQVRFIDWELRNTEKSVFKSLKDSSNMMDSLRAVVGYVRPTGYSKDTPELSSKWKDRVSSSYSLL